ncbi:MAG TPA: hypothetical protein DCQ98_07055, partial [Planctomycetaceae bacterium]|nr:hypothetical protein [Planctomycetaceae bacterium]
MYKFLLAWRYLRSRYIALASIVSVTLGVATLIVVNSVMSGFTSEMHKRLHGILSDIELMSPGLGEIYDVEAHVADIRRVLGDAGATEIRVSKDEAQRLLFWSGRKNAFPAVGRLSPDYYCMDGTIPRKALPRVLRAIAQWSE